MIDGRGRVGLEAAEEYHLLLASIIHLLCTTIAVVGYHHHRLSDAAAAPWLLHYSSIFAAIATNHKRLSDVAAAAAASLSPFLQVVRVLLQELSAARKGGAVGADCLYMARFLTGEASKGRCD